MATGLAALEGRRDEAIAGYQEALPLARQLEARASFTDQLLDAVHVLGPDDPETPEFGADVRAHFEQVGAQAYLDRLDEALQRALAPTATGAHVGRSVGRPVRRCLPDSVQWTTPITSG